MVTGGRSYAAAAAVVVVLVIIATVVVLRRRSADRREFLIRVARDLADAAGGGEQARPKGNSGRAESERAEADGQGYGGPDEQGDGGSDEQGDSGLDGRYTRDLSELVGATAGSFAPAKETLRSRGGGRGRAAADECLTGIGCGLGSTWIDPRFEPGPQALFPGGGRGGSATYAPGPDAGGPTFGAYTPAVFQTSGSWRRYVHGAGDGSLVAPGPGYDDA